jgi:hypothetical protein
MRTLVLAAVAGMVPPLRRVDLTNGDVGRVLSYFAMRASPFLCLRRKLQKTTTFKARILKNHHFSDFFRKPPVYLLTVIRNTDHAS